MDAFVLLPSADVSAKVSFHSLSYKAISLGIDHQLSLIPHFIPADDTITMATEIPAGTSPFEGRTHPKTICML